MFDYLVNFFKIIVSGTTRGFRNYKPPEWPSISLLLTWINKRYLYLHISHQIYVGQTWIILLLYILIYLPRHSNQFDTKGSNCFFLVTHSIFFHKQYEGNRTGKPHFLSKINLRLSATLIHKYRSIYINIFHISIALINSLAHFVPGD